MQEQHAPLGSVAVGGTHQDVDQIHQGSFQAEDGVLAVIFRVLEELVAERLFFVDHDLFGAVADDHVVDPLVGRPGDLGIVLQDIEIFRERAGPVFFLIVVQVLTTTDQGDQLRSSGHETFPS